MGLKYGLLGIADPPPSFPPTYYDNVEFVAEPIGIDGTFGNIRVFSNFSPWKWVPASARQIDREVVSDLAVTLEVYARSAKAAEMNKK
jgi:hypothetical protein